jgi:hypothetical protein
MAAESIGVIYSTKIPGYADNADIQAAFKLYHYGSTEYNIANSNTENLVNPSLAYSLNDLQEQIDSLDPSGGVSKSIIDAKGDLIIGLSNDTVDNLTVGSNNFILTADSSETLGIKWAAPEVSSTSSNTFTNKTISGSTNTITNVSLSTGITGILPVANGGTGLSSLASGITTFLATPSSANLAAVLTDETGTGANVFANSPTISTPTLTLSTSSSTTDAAIFWDTTNKKIKVGDGTTSNDFAPSTLLLNPQTGTSYTLVLADKDKLVRLANASPITLTVPTNTSVAYPVGTQINLVQAGAGKVTVAGFDGSVTINATPGLKLRAQWSTATLLKVDTNIWVLVGDTSLD